MVKGFSKLNQPLDFIAHTNALEDGRAFVAMIHQTNDKYMAFSSQTNDLRWQSQNMTPHHCIQQLETLTSDRSSNYYVSINGFYNHSRCESSLRHLNALWVDIDYYKIKAYQRFSPLKMFRLLEAEVPFLSVFQPTLVVSSGKGLYLLWKIDSAPKQVLNMWKRCMNQLHALFIPYGSDQLAKDVSRVLRLPGTLNQKNNQLAYTLKRSEAIYSLRQLGDTLIQKESAAPKALYKGSPHYHNKRAYAILKDIEKLVTLRQGEMKGFRERLCFVYRNFASLLYESTTVHYKLKALNQSFKTPLSDYEMSVSTKHAKHYAYCNQTLVQLFAITKEEQAHLTILIDEAMKKERRRVYKNQWQKKKNKEMARQDGQTNRNKQKQAQLQAIKQFLDEGLTPGEMALRMGVHKSTISRYLKELKTL